MNIPEIDITTDITQNLELLLNFQHYESQTPETIVQIQTSKINST